MTNNNNFVCKMCNTPVVIKKSMIYMKCMCDDEVRTIKYNSIDDIRRGFIDNIKCIFPTEKIVETEVFVKL